MEHDLKWPLATLGTRGFSRVRRKFSVLAEGRSHERRSHYKDYTETGNRTRKVSGTQGNLLRADVTNYFRGFLLYSI